MSVKKLPPIKQPSNAIVAKIQHKEAKRKGLIAAIEPKSGDYFLGKAHLKPSRKGAKNTPAQFSTASGLDILRFTNLGHS